MKDPLPGRVPAVPDDLRLIHLKSPLTPERRVDKTMPVGGTVVDMLEAAGIPLSSHEWLRVTVDGVPFPRDHWAHVRPPAGSLVLAQAVPQGGGNGAKVTRTILTIVVLAVAMYVGGPAGYGAVSPLAGAVAGGIVSVGGMLLINALVPLPSQDPSKLGRESPTYAVDGTQNRALPYQPVWRVYGSMRIYPPFAAQPFVMTEGEDQYVYLLFDCGYGPLALGQLKIGETLIEDFNQDADKPSVEVRRHEGFATDEPLSLYTNQVDTQSVGTTLLYGDYHVFTSATNADELILDFMFPGLVEVDPDDGGKAAATVQIEITYRSSSADSADPWVSDGVISNYGSGVSASVSAIGGGVYRTDAQVQSDFLDFEISGLSYPDFGSDVLGWSDVVYRAYGDTAWTYLWSSNLHVNQVTWDSVQSGSVVIKIPANKGRQMEVLLQNLGTGTPGSWSYTAPTVDQAIEEFTDARAVLVRRSVRIVPGARDQYDVQIRRLTVDSVSDYVVNGSILNALKTITYSDPTNVLGSHALVEMKIRATDQLQGMLDQFNVVATSLLRTRDSAGWTDPVVTANPAWIYADVLQGSATKRPMADARLDLDGLEAWAADCATNSREFNGVFDFKGTVFQTLSTVAAVGRASYSMVDGKYGVVRDVEQTVPVQLFTPRTSWGFTGTKVFLDMPDALKMRFKNAVEGWKDDERIVYRDGRNASNSTVFEVVDGLLGVTDADQAWLEGRYHLAVAELRPETFTLYTDFEHLICTRGDLVRVQYDVPLWGLGSARVKSFTVESATGYVDTVTVDAGFPMDDASGKSYALRFRFSDLSQEVVAVENEAAVTGDGYYSTLTLTTPTDLSLLAVGDLVAFGETDSETVECIVKAIEPQNDLSAKLTLLDAAPEIHDAGVLPQNFSPSDVNTTTNTIAVDGNPFYDGDEVQVESTDTLPAPLAELTTYYVVNRTSSSIQLAETSGGSPIDLTTQGAGTHTATRQVPDYDPQITLPPVLNRQVPDSPTIGSPRCELIYHGDGGVTVLVVVAISATNTNGIVADFFQAQYRLAAAIGWTTVPYVSADVGEYRIEGLVSGATYDLRFRSVTRSGKASAWVTSSVATDVDAIAPDTPANLDGDFDRRAVWWWDKNLEPDFDHYLISFDAYASEAKTKNNSAEVAEPTARSYTLYVKAVDRSGNESASYASKELTLPLPPAPVGIHGEDSAGEVLVTKTWSSVSLGVHSGFVRAPGHRGFLFRWSPDSGANWYAASNHPSAGVTVVVPLTYFAAATLTILIGCAQVDVVGAGDYGASSEVVLTKPNATDIGVSEGATANHIYTGYGVPSDSALGEDGDLYFDLTNGFEYWKISGAWELASDATETVINGGLVTTGTLLLKDAANAVKAGVSAYGAGDSAIRFWAGADSDVEASSADGRETAPFRVTQGGTLVAQDCAIAGSATFGDSTTGLHIAVGLVLKAGSLTVADPGVDLTNYETSGRISIYRWETSAWTLVNTLGYGGRFSAAGSFDGRGTGSTSGNIGLYATNNNSVEPSLKSVAQGDSSAVEAYAQGDGVALYGEATGTGAALSLTAGTGDLTILTDSFAVTALGGYAVKMVAGEDLVQGNVVSVSTTTDGYVIKTPTSGDIQDKPVGVVAADASSTNFVWVVTSGKAYVLPLSGTTAARGYLVFAGGEAGRADQVDAWGSVPPGQLVGVWTETGSGAGALALAILKWH